MHALDRTAYRGNLRGPARWAKLRRRAAALVPTGLQPEDVEALAALAAEKGDEPGALLAHWLDQNLWREVLDEQRMKRREQAAALRVTSAAETEAAELAAVNERRNGCRAAVAEAGGTR